jgi:hypothetical protein
MSDEIMRIVDKLCAEAIRPKGYSQSHARKIWKESTSQQAMRAMLYGSSSMKLQPGEFPRLVPLNSDAHHE